MTLLAAGALLGGLFLSGQAMAAKAYATTHLNIRSGPGEQYPIVGEMRWNSHGEVDGCVADYSWCHISTANGIGWAAAHYLIENTSRGTETLEKFGAQSGIPVVVPAAVVTTGEVVRVPAGTALIEAITPSDEVITFVSAQAVEPVFVTGEIVVGAVLPAEVALYEIPGSPYQFTLVNQARVLVEVPERKVVYIVR
jgi:uncharacterized protein YraI